MPLCWPVYACSLLQDRLPGRHLHAGASGCDDMHNAGVPAAGLCSNGGSYILAADTAAVRYGSYEGEAAYKVRLGLRL
jgi:hypothetical protein